MAIRDLMPRRRRTELARRTEGDLFADFRREMDRLFEDFIGALEWPVTDASGGPGFPTRWPRLNVAEADKEIVVTAELPGVNERDVNVELDGDRLTLKGEIWDEREERDRRWSRIERTSGRFQRTVHLPAEVRPDKAKADYKRGVLTITLPKAEASSARLKAIPIQTA